MISLESRYQEVLDRVNAATKASGRELTEVELVVITKTHPASVVAELMDLGHRVFGENKDQEAKPKALAVAELRPESKASWHFVGQLQSNKAKSVLSYATAIHSLDRASLLKELAKQLSAADSQVSGFIELNLTDDPNRGGVAPESLAMLADKAAEVDGLSILGVMAVAGLDVDPRVDFARAMRASAELQKLLPTATAVSMGMSADYELAIEMGATHVRVGSAITGPRGNN
ncbi:MAG: YggS family pyridoxal phosphate-dependent enzyme [Aquiluna sp.]|nr:YggS family pyridoxal phosphate-dependent enzyme [Aquiluna sp.]